MSQAKPGTPVGSEVDAGADATSSAINPMGLPLEDLRRLKDQFQDSHGQAIKLTQEQFVDALSTSRLRKQDSDSARWSSELCTLFKKIDAGCSDTVSWEEFTNYMLFHVPGFNSGDGARELSQSAAASEALTGAWQSGHADMINSICVLYDVATSSASGGGSGGSGRRYVTAGRDGYVKVWHPNLTLHKTIDVGQNCNWLSACCWMPRSRRLAVASSGFRIYFYDQSFSPYAHLDHKEGTPLCLGYTESHERKSSEKEILMVGDDKGFVTVYPMDQDWGEPEPKSDGKPDTDAGFKVKKATRWQYHTDWVTKVGYVSQLSYMVTSSLDGEINLCDVHVNRRKEGRDAVCLHKKGVHTWDWCKSYKFFASGGSDRQIIIWDPYTRRAITALQGHNAPVLDVLVNEGQHQLISTSLDKVVKVWDLLNFQCIQTFTDKTEYKPEDRITCMAFDEEGPALVLCSSLINVLPVSVKVETSRTHLAPIIGSLYNDVFNQVISGDNLGTVSVWDVQTGKLEFEFRRAHQDHKMTCMAFDESKRCLFTGAEDGKVKLWNFSSGQQLRTCTMKQPTEIRRLLWAREGPNTFVVGLAWDRRIYVWPDSRKQTVEPQYVLEDSSGHGHTDDLTCLSRLSSRNGLLATGGEDGYVCFWKIQAAGGNSNSRSYRVVDTTDQVAQKEGLAQVPVSGLENVMETKTRGKKKQAENFGSLNGRHISGKTSIDEAQAGAAASKGVDLNTAATKRASTFLQGYPDEKTTASSPVLEGGKRGSSSSVTDVTWPEELRSWSATAGMGTSAVDKMIFLEHKEALLSTHSDGRVRLWSTKSCEFLHRLELVAPAPVSAEAEGEGSTSPAPTYVHAQPASITSLYADSKENKWLFTGDADGWVRIWDLAPVNTNKCPTYLVRLKEMQPHNMAVTQLEHFELYDRVVIMTASADWTIALHTFEGLRIGSFSHRGPHWRLLDESSWSAQPPEMEEGVRPEEDDDGWGASPRRAGKPGVAGGRQDGAARNTGGVPGGGGGIGMRTPRGSKVRTRPVIAAQATSGQGDFGKLNVVEKFKPDLTIGEQEKARLAKWHVSEHSENRLAGGNLWSSRK